MLILKDFSAAFDTIDYGTSWGASLRWHLEPVFSVAMVLPGGMISESNTGESVFV